MADITKATDGPAPFSHAAYDFSLVPDYDNDFVSQEDFEAFASALAAPDTTPDDPDLSHQSSFFITALNDWRPIHQRVRGRRKGPVKKRRPPRRGIDETREGFVYQILKWPLFIMVMGWIILLGALYLLTRLYIYLYEHFVTWRGRRNRLRKQLQAKSSYQDWVQAAKELDVYLENEEWKKNDDYAYYDSKTVKRVKEQMKRTRERAETEEHGYQNGEVGSKAIHELRGLVEACVKNNFVGVENPRLYSETYYGTKYLVQAFVDEVQASLSVLVKTKQLTQDDKRTMFKHIHTNYGRTALCLSGGATFAYYHFGVAKALLDANLLPNVITGTSGGALVAALLATRTNDELKKLLVPALAGRINACRDDFLTWSRRWYRTGARFDSVDWAKRCAWFTRGSLTFREAYERTGRTLNVTCIPSDPHSPTILANYLTSPDCVVWSAVLASAAVPGIVNPVVLMKKNPDGTLAPYSFGHKWKDGSLRTDIPLQALNTHFNVNFSIVSQVNPHINLFFFSARGTVGRPVTHRRGRGWRGGFLGSAVEQYLKLDLTKWLKVLRHLELLPRWLGQDWSEVWLQTFSGTITLWPKSIPSDFLYILSDPPPERLARMIHVGQQSAFPKLHFIANRMKIERLIEEGRRSTRPERDGNRLQSTFSEEDLRRLLRNARRQDGAVAPPRLSTHRTLSSGRTTPGRRTPNPQDHDRADSPTISKRLSGWWNTLSPSASHSRKQSPVSARHSIDSASPTPEELDRAKAQQSHRRSSVLSEIGRQTRVFFDDVDVDTDGAGSAEDETAVEDDLARGVEQALQEAEDEDEWEVEADKDKMGGYWERGRWRDKDELQEGDIHNSSTNGEKTGGTFIG